jgi:hypothetical protein
MVGKNFELADRSKLLVKGTKFIWTSECEASFKELKCLLMSPPILAFPDFTRDFILYPPYVEAGKPSFQLVRLIFDSPLQNGTHCFSSSLKLRGFAIRYAMVL